jgi:hypothetical protein
VEAAAAAAAGSLGKMKAGSVGNDMVVELDYCVD